jgi:succinate-semialdehyde dehydrogenase/glutarate-semialdehyde dehydrogenase
MATEPAVTPRDAAGTRQTIVSTNPATGEALGEIPCATADDVRAAVSQAHAAQAQWASRSIRERAAVVKRFARLLQERKQEIAELISREAGKTYGEALATEVLVVLEAAKWTARNAYQILRDEPLPYGSLLTQAKRGKLIREPYGVIGIISPWNYPFSIPTTESLAALVAGNAVVLKPSEFTTLCALKLRDLLCEVGIPREIFHVVPGFGDVGAALTDSAIDKLIFTGSVATGKRVGESAAKKLLPVVLELGGKDAMLVLDDANVEIAAAAAVWGAFVNAGQTCLSVERCYVSRKLYDRFVASCVERTNALRIGNGADNATEVGPMIHEQQLRIVEAQVEDARANGATVLTGGTRLPELGPNFYAPTVIVGVDHSMRLMREETFGPVLPIIAFDSDDDAVALANDSEFGLAASVWTRDRQRGESVARRLNAGTVMINDVVSCFGIAEAPHGGVKASGIGRTHGRLGLDEVVRTKFVDTDYLSVLPKPWWYGAGPGFARGIESLIDALHGRGPGRIAALIRAARLIRWKP